MLSIQKIHSKSFTLKPLVQVNIGHSRSTSVYLVTDKQTTGLPGLLLLQLKSLGKTISKGDNRAGPPWQCRAGSAPGDPPSQPRSSPPPASPAGRCGGAPGSGTGSVIRYFLSLDARYFCHLVSPGVDDDGAEGVYGDRGGDGAAGGQLVQVVTQRDRLQLRERVRPWSEG